MSGIDNNLVFNSLFVIMQKSKPLYFQRVEIPAFRFVV